MTRVNGHGPTSDPKMRRKQRRDSARFFARLSIPAFLLAFATAMTVVVWSGMASGVHFCGKGRDACTNVHDTASMIGLAFAFLFALAVLFPLWFSILRLVLRLFGRQR